MQHTVAKRFIHCKHNITIPHTQVIPQKVVTFFENLKSWSHLALFVWDWIAGENRIESNFTRFYRIAKGVTHNNSAGFAPLNRQRLTSWYRKRSRLLDSFKVVNPPGLEPGTPTLKVLCSTCWATDSSFQIGLSPFLVVQRYKLFLLYQNLFCFYCVFSIVCDRVNERVLHP